MLLPGVARAEGEDGGGSEETSSAFFKYEDTDGGVSITGLNSGYPKALVIPAKIDGKTVVAIGYSAFYTSSITSVEIPSSVTAIGNSAFSWCESLTSVTFAAESQLASIGENAFLFTGITSIEIPSSVTTIDRMAFASCRSLTSVSFGADSKLTSIGGYTFEGSGITSIEIPSSVTTIEEGAFSNCRSLTSVSFGADSKLTSIGNNAFVYSGITSIEIPSSVTTIDQMAFNGCTSLTSVSFASGSKLTSIGFHAFESSSITSIEIPSSVTTIDDCAFSNCKSLTSVTFGADSKLTSIGDGSFEYSGITSIEIPSSVTTIKKYAFRDNTALEYIAVSDEAAYNKYKDQILASDKLVVRSQETLSLSDESGFAFNIPTLYAKDAISYNRPLDTGETTQDQYATLCLPFALHLSQTNNLFDKVYVPMNTLIHNTAKSTPNQEHFVLMLEEQASDAIIPAGQPVFVKLQGGTENISLANHADAAFTAGFQPKTETMKVVDWDGTSGLMTQNKQFAISYGSLFQPKAEVTADDHIWSFNANGSFGPQRKGVMPPFRLFLTVEENAPTVQAKAYSISIGVSDDSTTGIREIIPADAAGTSGSSKHDGIIYDLNGRKVAAADKAKYQPKGIYILNGKKMVIN